MGRENGGTGGAAQPGPTRDGDDVPEHDPALRDRLLRLVGVLRRAATARDRPVRHTRGYLAELRLVEVADQGAVRRPLPVGPPGSPERELLRVARDPDHAATFDALVDLARRVADAPEGVEIVLAAALLHAPGDPDVHGHLLTQAVCVDRDAATGEMVAALAADVVTVEDDELLGGTDLLDAHAAAAERGRWAAALASPLDPALNGLLGPWAERCLRGAVAVGDDWIAPTDERRRLVPAPALVVRRRRASALRAVHDRLAADLADPARPLPVGLAQLVAAIEPAEREAWLARAGHGAPLVADPLFPLPAGRAQARILSRLGGDSGVVVEGPPGTGKTHTIANLVAALLAEGRRVLVTSEKAQALRVLRDMLPPGMRDLCVSLGDADADPDDGTAGAAASVTALASAATEFDPDEAARRIGELESRRAALLAERERVLDAVVARREAESTVHDEVAPGFAGTRAEIARRVRATAGRDGWLAEHVDPAILLPAEPPCTAGELAGLLSRRRGHEPDGDEPGHPPPATGDERAALVAALGALPAAAAAHLPGVCRRIADAVVELEDTGEDRDWARGVADAVLSGRAGHPWSRAVEQLAGVDDLLEHDRAAGAVAVRVTEAVDPATAAPAAERLAAWLDAGHGPRRWFKDGTQRELEARLRGVEVAGGEVATPAGARAAAHHLRMLEITDRLAAAFAPLDRPVRRAEHRPLLVEQALALRATCVQVGSVLTAAAQLRSVLAALPAARRPRVDSLGVLETAATVASGVAAARTEQHQRQQADRVAARLEAVAPGLLAALDAGDAGDAEAAGGQARARRWCEAWAHARAVSWLARTAPGGPGGPAGLAGLDDLDDDLAAVTTELATARAWRACLARVTAEQSRALQSHRAATVAIGRGAGRHAEHYRRAARDAVRVARGAVPAWVMPIREVLTAVEARRDAVDVVVVDEASQADLTSLFLLWLAPRVIVVGDDRQCTPAEVGAGSLEPAFARLETDLPDVPTYLRSHLTPRSSVFSVLRATFGPPIRLREHFRSMPEIIDFSSRTFYAGPDDTAGRGDPLVPLRRCGADRLPPLRSTLVPRAATTGSGAGLACPAEAAVLVDAVVACDTDPAYAEATFGVVVLQGHGQVELIEALLRERLAPERWAARRLRVGVPADFQGDERGVVWLSMVVAPGHRLVALTAERYRQGFNVAASRARDQLWLVHAVTADQLAPADLRRRLLEHVTHPPDPVGTAVAPRLARRVAAALRARGFAVAPGVEVGGRRLDLVVTGHGGRLAVLCDGAERAAPTTRADVEREQELRRLGWPVARVRESDHAADPDAVIQGLLDGLRGAGVTPATGTVAVADRAPGPRADGSRPAYVPGAPDADTGALDRLVVELGEAGLPVPRRDAEVHDPFGGGLLCAAEALWPTGITRHALAAPVVYVHDGDADATGDDGGDATSHVARLRSLGYEVFTTVAALRAHALPDPAVPGPRVRPR